MKKFIAIFSIAAIIASCNRGTQNTDNSATDSQAAQAGMDAQKQAVIDSMSAVNQQQKTTDSLNAITAERSKPGRRESSSKTVTHTQSVTAPVTTTTATPATATSIPATTTSTQTTTVQKKQGWTGAEKGAVIGSGVGVLTGVLAGKHGHKAGSAIIGGLLGAGAGAGTGALIDHSNKKKDSTYQ